ncbi:metallophosphoesterase [Chloroflexota bacterium]
MVLFYSLLSCRPVETPSPQVTLGSTDITTIPLVSTSPDPTPIETARVSQEHFGEPVVESTNGDFIATEILGRPTDSSITVNIVPAKAMELYYEYGTTIDVYTSKTAPQNAIPGVPLETLIDGLKPNTRYYYRVRFAEAAGMEHTFMTQRSPGSTFTFAVQGDSHPERIRKEFNSDLYTSTLLKAGSDRPDFYLTIGDDFSVDQLKTVSAETVTDLYINQRQYLGQVGAPVFLVNGNHERSALYNLDGSPENVAVWAQNARNTYFPQPAPDNFYSGDSEPIDHIGLLRDYYAWTWGDALFVVIDPYWHTASNVFGGNKDGRAKRDLWDVTIGNAQYPWLIQTLGQSTAKYKFVFAHHVHGTGRGGIELANLYEWGGENQVGKDAFAQNRPGWDKPIHQVMVDNRVTIFFQGHDHIFVRQELDGVIYQTLPEPANPNNSLLNAEAYNSGDKLPNSGYVRVTVSADGVTVEYIKSVLPQDEKNGHTDGEVAFSYTVRP